MGLLPSDAVTASFRWWRRRLAMGNHYSDDGGGVLPPVTIDDATAGDGCFGMQ